MPLRVAVIGGGIVGLAAAAELTHAGAAVTVFERTGVASAQSLGDTRIFRVAHGTPALVALAVRAREAWGTWEAWFGRRLVGDEQLILAGEELAAGWSEAMAGGGAPSRPLDAAGWESLLPIGSLPAMPSTIDPLGGVTRARRTVEFLTLGLRENIRLAPVLSVEPAGEGCIIRFAGGQQTFDEAIVAAGIDTCTLVAPLGLDIPMRVALHSRFSYRVRAPFRARRLACLIDGSGAVDGLHTYGQPVGTTGRYALGVHWPGEESGPDVGAEEVSRQSRERGMAYVRAALPGLEPEPVDEIRCAYPEYAFGTDGDGFIARRRERITAIYGDNLFKFAPLLGALLRDTVLTGRLPPELQLYHVP